MREGRRSGSEVRRLTHRVAGLSLETQPISRALKRKTLGHIVAEGLYIYIKDLFMTQLFSLETIQQAIPRL
jgi:hypothetical protein